MEHISKFLRGIVFSALASAIVWGSAAAVPVPTYPSHSDPSSNPVVTGAPAPQHALAPAPGERILSRSGRLAAAGRLSGSSSESVSGSAARSSRWKNRYLMSGLVLATLTPLVLHRSGEPGDKSVAVETQAPASSSLPALGGRGGRGNDRGGKDGHGDNPGRGGNRGDDDGDDEGEDNGNNGGNTGNNGDDHGGDDRGGSGGGGALPEPGTVPLIGAGLIMALALRSRRDR